MTQNIYDIIIIGSGISGMYSAYNILKINPHIKILIVEKYKKEWLGGRTSNEDFYGSTIVTGAGVGRKHKDYLLKQLVDDLSIKYKECEVNPHFGCSVVTPVNVKKVIEYLREVYKSYKVAPRVTFSTFAKKHLGNKLYQQFLISSGYTDFENEGIYETLYYYGIEDNLCCWTSMMIPWRQMVLKLYHEIGEHRFKFSTNIVSLVKVNNNPIVFKLTTKNGEELFTNKVIIATTIDSVQTLLPQYKIYKEIHGQPFLRVYAKFNKKTTELLKKCINGYTIVAGPLYKIIPINKDTGVYMIAYCDNKGALALKPYLDNKDVFEQLLEQSLCLPNKSIHIIALKHFYWSIGTHYYEPLSAIYKNRQQFIYKAQHPEKNMLVVGECVSTNQGWTQGALESVKKVLTPRWILHT